MSSIRTFYLRLRGLFRKNQTESDLAEELQFHLQKGIEKNVKAGMTPEEARYAALRTFGGVEQVKEECRDVRRVRLLEEIWQDLKYGLRMLRKSPGFTIVAVLSLALGIGANSAIFSVVNAVLLRPLPYPEPEQLFMVWKLVLPGVGGLGASPAEFLAWREQNHVLRDMGSFFPQTFNLTGRGDPVQIEGLRATAGFFNTLGIQAKRGRTFFPEEEKPGSAPVALVSYRLWEQQFEGDPSLLGKTINLNGEQHVVVGILPASFEFSRYPADVWVPLSLNVPAGNSVRLNLTVVARVKQGITRQQAQAEMDVIATRLRAKTGKDESGEGPLLVPLQRDVVGNAVEVLLPLLGAVGLVLLIGCATAANLLLSRAAGRKKEMAIRAALGAGRLRLIRQLLTESVLLATLGGWLGLLLAYWGTKALIAAGPKDIPRLQEIVVDLQVAGFTLLISMLTGLMFGLAPALRTSKVGLNESLKEAGQGAGIGPGRQLLGQGLVACEVALALVLLIGAGLLINSFARLIRVNPGFRAEGVLTMRISLPPHSYPNGRAVSTYFRQVVERVKAVPSVQQAAVVSYLPLGRGVIHVAFTLREGIPWIPGDENKEWHTREFYPISPGYFQAMGTPLLRGRELTERDNLEGAPPVIIVNDSLAREFFPDQDPIGKQIRLMAGPVYMSSTIVGIVSDIKKAGGGDNQLWLSQQAIGAIYLPHSLLPEEEYHLPWSIGSQMYLVIRTKSDPMHVAEAVRRQIWAVDRGQPVTDVKTMEQNLMDSVVSRRISMLQLVIFAGVALLLAASGIYGVVAYSVARRTREIGIRIALGSRKKDVLFLIMRQSLLPALLGSMVGIAGSQILTRLLASQLFGITSTDLTTYIAVTLVLFFVVGMASYVPSRRATKVDPIVALRYE